MHTNFKRKVCSAGYSINLHYLLATKFTTYKIANYSNFLVNINQIEYKIFILKNRTLKIVPVVEQKSETVTSRILRGTNDKEV